MGGDITRGKIHYHSMLTIPIILWKNKNPTAGWPFKKNFLELSEFKSGVLIFRVRNQYCSTVRKTYEHTFMHKSFLSHNQMEAIT